MGFTNVKMLEKGILRLKVPCRENRHILFGELRHQASPKYGMELSYFASLFKWNSVQKPIAPLGKRKSDLGLELSSFVPILLSGALEGCFRTAMPQGGRALWREGSLCRISLQTGACLGGSELEAPAFSSRRCWWARGSLARAVDFAESKCMKR